MKKLLFSVLILSSALVLAGDQNQPAQQDFVLVMERMADRYPLDMKITEKMVAELRTQLTPKAIASLTQQELEAYIAYFLAGKKRAVDPVQAGLVGTFASLYTIGLVDVCSGGTHSHRMSKTTTELFTKSAYTKTAEAFNVRPSLFEALKSKPASFWGWTVGLLAAGTAVWYYFHNKWIHKTAERALYTVYAPDVIARARAKVAAAHTDL